MRCNTLAAGFLTLGLFLAPAAAQPGTAFTYQGSLSDAGTPATGTYAMDFTLWNALAGGSQVGPLIHIPGQTVDLGVFTAQLNFGATAYSTDPLWLQINVDGTTLSPRHPITGSPYSVQTRGLHVDAASNVAIGHTAPLFPLHVKTLNGTVAIRGDQLSTTGAVWGVRGTSASSGGVGIYGTNSSLTGGSLGGYFANSSTDGGGLEGKAANTVGVTFGVHGSNHSVSGRGVFGNAHALSGFTEGVRGEVRSPNGVGVVGDATSLTGSAAGVYGQTSSPSGTGVLGWAIDISGANVGVRGLSGSSSGSGVIGRATSGLGTNFGVWAESMSPSGTGVLGKHTASTGTAPGVLGESNSTTGSAIGVHGRINTTSAGAFSAAVRGENKGTGFGGIGVYGSHNGNGWGLYGLSQGGRGVFGVANESTGVNYAVYGQSNSTSGFDFYAAGAGINYGVASSIRWKNNIANIESPLDKLASLRGVTFDWDAEHGGHQDIGFIAEEVGKVLPEIVSFEEDGVYANGMDYSKLTPLLVEAVNALRAENDSIKDENDTLRARLRAIEAHLNLPSTIEIELP